MVSIGVSGIAGSGKSLLCSFFVNDGAALLDLDAYAHSLYDDPGEKVFRELVEKFSPRVPGLVSPEGSINRKALGALVFSDERALFELNSIFFPRFCNRVGEAIAAARAGGRHSFVVDAAVLFECRLEKLLDATVWVDSPDPALAERLVKKRGWSGEYSADVVASQRKKYSRYSSEATFVVMNDAGENELYQKYLKIKKEIFK